MYFVCLQLTYSILSSSDSSNGSFSVGRSSGAIEVRRRLDREGIPAHMHDEHTFQVCPDKADNVHGFCKIHSHFSL